MISIRKSKDRGHMDFGWLNTHHTFSFDQYFDPDYMGFHTLRVINQDIVQPGEGFPTHHHKNMEILTYVLHGAVTHKDSMNNEIMIKAGEIQCMSAGSGVSHSEYNSSDKEILELLQIWILPEKANLEPGYQQIQYDKDKQGLQLLASKDGADGSILLHQTVKVYRGFFSVAAQLEYPADHHHVWIQMIDGQISVNEQLLEKGDGAGISDERNLKFKVEKPSEFLLFDLY